MWVNRFNKLISDAVKEIPNRKTPLLDGLRYSLNSAMARARQERKNVGTTFRRKRNGDDIPQQPLDSNGHREHKEDS